MVGRLVQALADGGCWSARSSLWNDGKGLTEAASMPKLKPARSLELAVVADD